MLMLNLWDSYQAVRPSFALEKRGGLLTRHLFSVKRTTARKWLYHFRLRGRHFDSYAHIMDFNGCSNNCCPEWDFFPFSATLALVATKF